MAKNTSNSSGYNRANNDNDKEKQSITRNEGKKNNKSLKAFQHS